MTDEQLFKQHYPEATIERKRDGVSGKYFYLVRKKPREFLCPGCGDTKSQAWADAVKTLSIKTS